VQGRVEPIFVEHLGELAQAARAHLQDGDVLITMGAGSMGQVPLQLVEGAAA